MATAKDGKTVKVTYTGKLTSGEVFDQTTSEKPLQFTLGEKQLIAGFENAVRGMEQGEKKTVVIKPEEAYGPYDEKAVIETSRSVLPDNLEPEIGQRLQAQDKNENQILVTITKLDESAVTLDANHPLAGKDLEFEIELLEVA